MGGYGENYVKEYLTRDVLGSELVAIADPFATKSSFISLSDDISTRLPSAIYAIIIMGTTISFAGNPKINAIKITPSSPISDENGSKKLAA